MSNEDDINIFLREANNHKPYETTSHWETEAKYWEWLRGSLRKLWLRWPPRIELKNERRISVQQYEIVSNRRVLKRYKTGKRKGKPVTRFEIECEVCNKTFPQAKVDADHISPAGSCNSPIEACIFLYKLLCDKDNLRLVCKGCHGIITYSEKMGMTFEQAAKAKRVIALTKPTNKSVDKQKRQLLQYGYTSVEVKNAASRKKCYTKLVEEGKL